jgi:hypothetical protein
MTLNTPFSRRPVTSVWRESLYRLLSYRNTVILGFLRGLPLLRFSGIDGIVGGIIPALPSPLL